VVCDPLKKAFPCLGVLEEIEFVCTKKINGHGCHCFDVNEAAQSHRVEMRNQFDFSVSRRPGDAISPKCV
jgi:hypothetical protein